MMAQRCPAGERLMIINHKYKFIFIKTLKTAGTSIEIALSQFCETGDTITPITKEDESKRQELGFRGPRNYNVPLRFYRKKDWRRLLWTRKPKQFFNHAGASYIRENVKREIWNSYFKFCFERNPFDKAISRYYWSTREPRPEISSYLQSVSVKLLSNWELYTINDEIAVDFVGRYDHLADDLAIVTKKLAFPNEIVLPKAKGSYRVNRDHYGKILNPQARSRIELVCAKEIKAFDCRWQEPQDIYKAPSGVSGFVSTATGSSEVAGDFGRPE